MRWRILLPLVLAVSLSVGCASRRYDDDYDRRYPSQGPGYGPPPHAPAHGYRHKHHDRELEYDSRRGVYVVLDLSDVFWIDGWYHRRVGDRWQHGERWDGPWYDSAWDQIPPGLRGGKNKGKNKDRSGPGPY